MARGLLDTVFCPRRVALVGASERPGTVGALLRANLASYPGEVVPVRAGQSLREVGRDVGPIDLAVVAVPAAAVPGVAADAAAAGVGALVVLSGGFAEVGPDGAALQAALVQAARSGTTPVRVLGPNCFGVQNCDLPLNASIAAGLPTGGGGISVITQSGAYGMAVYDLATEEGVAFAKVCAPGNSCEVTVTELLDALAEDPATRVLCLLLESLPDGRAFAERARQVVPDKPVVVLKTGRSVDGARAAASHTAALAAPEAVWRGALAQAGVVTVGNGRELLDAARVLDAQPLPAGNRVAVITNSGGAGVELADLLTDEGLGVPELSAGLQERVRDLLPPYASAANPVDMTTAWRLFPTAYPALVDLLARSGEVDFVVPVLLQRAATDQQTVTGVAAAVARLREDGVPVPVCACWVAPRSAAELARSLQVAGVPVLVGPDRTARALGHAHRAAAARARLRRSTATAPGVAPGVAPHPAHGPGRDPDRDLDDPLALAGLLREAGITTVDTVVCRTAEQAAAAAARWVDDGPVVVKVARAAHRSDSGGVRLDLDSASAAEAAAADLLAGGGDVLVSPQLTGVEVVVGALRDPSFGPVVMAGLGGIWVEVFADVAFALAPLTRREARDLLLSVRGAPLLTGARGGPAVDLDALADVVVAVGRLLTDLPGLRGLDLNPVLVTPFGAVAVDWKAVV